MARQSKERVQQQEKNEMLEKCGVVGVWMPEETATQFAAYAARFLQHRGYGGAGSARYSSHERSIITHRGSGMIRDVLTEEFIQGHPSNTAIVHNRYPTTGELNGNNVQPIVREAGSHRIVVTQNGNISEFDELKSQVTEHLNGSSDTAYLASFLIQERCKYDSWEQTFKASLPNIRGSYCLIMMTEDGSLWAARDPQGIRPLCLGRIQEKGWIIASESVAITGVNGAFAREVLPGELIHISQTGQLASSFFGDPKRQRRCSLEEIYFSNKASFQNGRRIRNGREDSGRLLAGLIDQREVKVDTVIPVMDSGHPAATGVATELDLPLVHAISINPEVGRTFIRPTPGEREGALNLKHTIVPEEIEHGNVLLVDDSLIRGATSKNLRRKAQDASVHEVHFGFAAPPVVEACDLGVEMKVEHLAAAPVKGMPQHIVEEYIAREIGADSVTYLTVSHMAQAFLGNPEDFCTYCFGGQHPIREVSEIFKRKERLIEGKPKILICLSGNGTNAQEIIDQVESGAIDAEIIGVVSNDPDAFGLERARKHKITRYPISYLPAKKPKEDDPNREKILEEERLKRSKFEEMFREIILDLQPDLVVLAGFMVVIPDETIRALRDCEIPIINLHPALLNSDGGDTVRTSKGTIPAIRGTHAIARAHKKGLKVTGASAHQVIEGGFDKGPVIVKEEVRIYPEDTLEDLEHRVHEAEYRVLPLAIKKAIQALNHGIDISTGTYHW